MSRITCLASRSLGHCAWLGIYLYLVKHVLATDFDAGNDEVFQVEPPSGLAVVGSCGHICLASSLHQHGLGRECLAMPAVATKSTNGVGGRSMPPTRGLVGHIVLASMLRFVALSDETTSCAYSCSGSNHMAAPASTEH